jgi:ferrous iron transport protein A
VPTVTEQLCARCLVTPPPAECLRATTLADLPRGCVGRVIGFSDELDAHVSRRLFDLGFAPGASAEFLRSAPWRDPLVFRIAGTEIVLRTREARQVLVAA